MARVLALALAIAAGVLRASAEPKWECPAGYMNAPDCAESFACDRTKVALGSGPACSSEGALQEDLDGGAGRVYFGCAGGECCNCWKLEPLEAAAEPRETGAAEVETQVATPRRCFNPCELDCRKQCDAPWTMSCQSYCQNQCYCACPYQCQQSNCRSNPRCRRGKAVNGDIFFP